MDWTKLTPIAKKIKRKTAKMFDMSPEYISRLDAEKKKTSQLFREKVAADLARAMKGKT